MSHLKVLDAVLQAHVEPSLELGEFECVCLAVVVDVNELNSCSLASYLCIQRRSKDRCEDHVDAVVCSCL